MESQALNILKKLNNRLSYLEANIVLPPSLSTVEIFEEISPKITNLNTNSAYDWPMFVKLEKFWPDGAPIDDLGNKIGFINFKLGKIQMKTNYNTITCEKGKVPKGLHVFKSSLKFDIDKINLKIKKLFQIIENGPDKYEISKIKKHDSRFFFEKHKMEHCCGIFRPKTNETAPLFTDCMSALKDYDEELYNFVLAQAKICIKIMGVDLSELDKCQVQLIRYLKHGGMTVHIDGVHHFNNTIGPVFTVNLNNNPKYLDLFPLCIHGETPKRLTTYKGEITMLDAESRTVWGHSIPFGNEDECYTLAFKFPCMDKYLHDQSGGYSDLFNIYIPQNIKQ